MKKLFFKIFKFMKWTLIILITLVVSIAIYLYNTKPIIKYIINNNESKLYYFPKKKLVSMDEFDYIEKMILVEDSIKIYTYSFKSSGQKPKGNIFFIHGAGGNVSTYKGLIKTLTNNGFMVYALDWRGYGRSKGTPTYKGVLKDTEYAFIDFINKVENDSVKTIIYGLSLGGQIAVKIAKDNQNKIDALVLDSSIESAQSMAIKYAPVEFLKEKARKNPQKFNQDYVALRDIKDIVDTPKLIIHSKMDNDVPFIHGKRLFAAAKEPKIFWNPNTEHILALKKVPNKTILKINQLLQE